MKVRDKHFSLIIRKEEIVSRVIEIANEINRDYQNKDLLFLAVLNGSFVFVADLVRHVTVPCEISFIKLASYRMTQSSGEVREIIGLNESISGRHVVIVEDIIDTGLTLSKAIYEIDALAPASVNIVSLLFKPETLRVEIDPKYVGFYLPDKFVVGYGLDYDGYGRNLNEIYQEV